jgi:hypothetical protein
MFALQFDDGDEGATRILHRPSGKVAPIYDCLTITGDFEIAHNWSEAKACLVKGSVQSYPCSKFFKKGEGPHADLPLGGNCVQFNTIVKTAAQQFEKVRADLLAGTAVVKVKAEDAFDKPKLDKKKLATEKARTALKVKHEELAKRRRVSVAKDVAA